MSWKWQVLKIGGGLLLLAAFFLPVASCTSHAAYSPQANVESQAGEGETISEEGIHVFYPSRYFDASKIEGWGMLSAFAWPFPVLGFQILSRRKTFQVLLAFLGLGLSFWSAYLSYSIIAFFGKWEIGGYLMVFSIGVLFLVYFLEAVVSIRSFRSRNAPLPG